MRVGLFTNNYLPFRGGVTTAVETLRQGLEAEGHQAWVFAPAWGGRPADPSFVFRYPSAPAPTYPGFAVPLPFSRRLRRAACALELDVFHAQHPFLLGVTARRLARAQGRPLVFTYHTRYEKYAHYVPLPERLVAAASGRPACGCPSRWCPRACPSISSARETAARRDASSTFPTRRPSAFTWVASIARRAWSACWRPSAPSPTRCPARACFWSVREVTRGASSAWPPPVRPAPSSASPARWPARRCRPTIARPISSSSRPRRKRRGLSSPRRMLVGC